jgi:putative peptide zinc metalloprotease protein
VDTTTRPRLRSDLELLRGMDDIPLLYDRSTGIYHRLSGSAAALLGRLDGTAQAGDLARAIAHQRPCELPSAEAEVQRFLDELDRGGLLDRAARTGGQPLPAPIRSPAHVAPRVRWSLLLPRITLLRSLDAVLEPTARLVRRLPARPTVTAWAGVSVLGYLAAAAALVPALTAGAHPLATGPAGSTAGLAAVAAIAVFLVQIAFHEGAHALVCQVLRIPARGAGVGLLFFVMPLAFVDRTDAYRIRGRAGRVLIALAGPLSDGWWAGATALVATSTHGTVHAVASALLLLQLLGVLTNLNPLLPSDGYCAVESGFGLADPRSRALTLLKHTALRRPLPSYLSAAPRSARIGYAVYGGVCLLYAAAVAAMVVNQTVHTWQSLGMLS